MYGGVGGMYEGQAVDTLPIALLLSTHPKAVGASELFSFFAMKRSSPGMLLIWLVYLALLLGALAPGPVAAQIGAPGYVLNFNTANQQYVNLGPTAGFGSIPYTLEA